MRGPLRALGFANKFEDAVAHEESNPALAACAFVGIALDLSTAGFDGHASALRRRAAQAYVAAGRHANAAGLQLHILASAILAGRWDSISGQVLELQRVRDDQAINEGQPDAGLTAAVALAEVAAGVLNDPVLAAPISRQLSRPWPGISPRCSMARTTAQSTTPPSCS